MILIKLSIRPEKYVLVDNILVRMIESLIRVLMPFSLAKSEFGSQGWRNRGGGGGGHGPPKNLSGWAKVCFGPPQNFDHWPPQNGWPVVKIFAKLLLSTQKCAKFSKFFRLRRAYMGRTYSSGDFMLFQSKFLYLVIFFST